jgi:hypothetical protein
VRPPEPGVLPPGHRLPHVALVLQWRQDHPNKLPPTWATAISEMGQNLPPALRNRGNAPKGSPRRPGHRRHSDLRERRQSL